MECNPEGPYPYGPGMYRCIKLCRDLYRDPKRRPPFRPVRRQAFRITGWQAGGRPFLVPSQVILYTFGKV